MHLNELKYHAADLVRMLPEQTLARMAVTTSMPQLHYAIQVAIGFILQNIGLNRFTLLNLKRKETFFDILGKRISVGYRVKSIRGTQFRQWANRVSH